MKIGAFILAAWTLLLLALLFLPVQINFIPMPGGFSHFDKVAHFGLFGVTGFLGIYGSTFFASFRYRLLFGLVFGLVLAAGTEAVQYFIPYRDMEFYDLLSDWAGLFLGLLSYTFYYTWKSRL
jgi:VanZ family protein